MIIITMNCYKLTCSNTVRRRLQYTDIKVLGEVFRVLVLSLRSFYIEGNVAEEQQVLGWVFFFSFF